MNSKLPESQSSEEVDLGQLFNSIGKAFDRLFRFIGSIFKGFYHVILISLIHFFKRKYWYLAALIVGLISGFILDANSEKLYGANMFIETNFGSARQVYENIKYLNQIAVEKQDSEELSEIFGITQKEASTLKGFYIEPDVDMETKVKMFSNNYSQLDSLTKLAYTFNEFEKELNSYNFSSHKIEVVSTDITIYSKLRNEFVKIISNNPYLDNIKTVNSSNLKKMNKALLEKISKSDSLALGYLQMRINESKRSVGSVTNLYMDLTEEDKSLMEESEPSNTSLDFEREIRKNDSLLVVQKKHR